MINAALKNRGLIRDFVSRDFKARFAGSILGVTWNVINPLVMILIYIVIFSRVMRAKLPGVPSKYGYSIYLCSAIIPWVMFVELLNRYTNLFFEHGNMIKKVNFPRETLHISAMITGTINFFISFSIFMFFLAILHLSGLHEVQIGFERMLLLFVILGFQQLFCLGLGFGFSVLNVFFRDVGQFVGIISQLWFWFTPIVYPLAVVPGALKKFYVLNPMYHFMKIYRSILYLNQNPEWNTVGLVIVTAIFTFLIGFLIYRKLRDGITDEI